jgi:hypothetical protein
VFVYVLWATIYCINPGAHECDAGFKGPFFDEKKTARIATFSDGAFLFKTESAGRTAVKSAVVKDQAHTQQLAQQAVTSVWSSPEYECRKTEVTE